MTDELSVKFDRTHPRYNSLIRREKIVQGYKSGIVVSQGLIAHGRGEMFDYILGEITTQPAIEAERAAAAAMLLAERPVISVNGNLAALCPEQVVRLAEVADARLEVNLFHSSKKRLKRIRKILESYDAMDVLAEEPDGFLEGLSHERGRCHSKGILSSDVVLIPLEDGDRASALVDTGKTVISIDLNPLSRTSLCASISIVDEVTRAFPNIVKFSKEMKNDKASASILLESYDNKKILKSLYQSILRRFEQLSSE